MRRAFVIVCTCAAAQPLAAQQRSSVWLDASGVHNRPPAGAAVAASTHGLLGARLRVDGTGSSTEFGASFGRGPDASGGSWITGRGAYDASRVRGVIDIGMRIDGSGLVYVTPVAVGGGSEYSQSTLTGTVRPHAGLSVGGFRLGIEGTLTGGLWRSEVNSPLAGGPFPPLPGTGNVDSRTVSDDGAISIVGGAASVLRVFGPASLDVRAGSYHAKNQVSDGRFSGVDATLGVALGAADITAGARAWRTPADSVELGGHAGIGFAIGRSAYLQAIASRSISDPVLGAAGGTGFSVGLSIRVGGASAGREIARVGSTSGRGRVVTFSLAHAGARSVAVAGDFSGWEPRALQRGTGNVWTLDTVLEPGVYHFSFIIDGETWMVPDDATGIIDDGFGRRNATVIVNAMKEQVTP